MIKFVFHNIIASGKLAIRAIVIFYAVVILCSDRIFLGCFKENEKHLNRSGYHTCSSCGRSSNASERRFVSDWFMVAFTAIIALVGVSSAIISYEQQLVMQKQLREIRGGNVASQRGWLKVTSVKLSTGTGLNFDKSGDGVSLDITIQNVGNAPAIKVSWHASLILTGLGPAGLDKNVDCASLRSQTNYIGATVFPNDLVTVGVGAGTGWDEIPKVVIWGGNVEGCVDYTFGTDPNNHHQTPFIYAFALPRPVLIAQKIVSRVGNHVEIPLNNIPLVKIDVGEGAD